MPRESRAYLFSVMNRTIELAQLAQKEMHSKQKSFIEIIDYLEKINRRI